MLQGALCFDFDETLVTTKQFGIADSWYSYMRAKRQQGWFWVINTGRSLAEWLIDYRRFEQNFWPDALIAKEREIYLPQCTKPSQIKQWRKLACWERQYQHDLKQFHCQNKVLLQQAKAFTETIAARWFEYDTPEIITESLQQTQVVVKYIESLRQQYPSCHYLYNDIYFRFTPQGYHKGTTLDYLCQYYTIPVNQRFVIGDNYNDLGMLDNNIAGMIACVENSVASVKNNVKRQGGYVAKQQSSLGCLEALKFYLDN